MPRAAPLVDAMRVLHCCYCCDDADAAVRFLEAGVGLDARVRSPGIRADGSPLGIPRTIESDVCLVYDARGARVSPAIEVHGWIDPPAVGTPYDDPTNIGIQAIGVGVPVLEDALARLTDAGADVVGRSEREVLSFGGPAAVIRAPDGVVFDVVERPGLGAVELVHVRATCSDLGESIAWYEALGHSTVEDAHDVTVPGSVVARDRELVGSCARLRLPDERFDLLLVEWNDPPSGGAPYGAANHRGLYRLALGVEDTRAATTRLVDAGWTPTSAPNLIELPGTEVPDMWITFFADPDGIVVQLVERTRDAFVSPRPD